MKDWSGKNARPVPLPEPQPEIQIPSQPVEPIAQKAIDPAFSQLAKSLRNLDLQAIAPVLGLERDRSDKSKWIAWAEVDGQREKQHVISITDNKFMDWKTEQGRVGAISLTMAVRDWDFKSAVEWLATQKEQRSRPASDGARPEGMATTGTNRH